MTASGLGPGSAALVPDNALFISKSDARVTSPFPAVGPLPEAMELTIFLIVSKTLPI